MFVCNDYPFCGAIVENKEEAIRLFERYGTVTSSHSNNGYFIIGANGALPNSEAFGEINRHANEVVIKYETLFMFREAFLVRKKLKQKKRISGRISMAELIKPLLPIAALNIFLVVGWFSLKALNYSSREDIKFSGTGVNHQRISLRKKYAWRFYETN